MYKEKKKRGEKVGSIKKRIIEDTGLSSSQVGRLQNVSKNLIPELKELVGDKLATSTANEFAGLSEENQLEIAKILKDKINITREESIKLKNELKSLEDKNSILKSKAQNNDVNKVQKEVERKANEILVKYKEEKEEAQREAEELKKEIDRLKKEKNTEVDEEIKALKIALKIKNRLTKETKTLSTSIDNISALVEESKSLDLEDKEGMQKRLDNILYNIGYIEHYIDNYLDKDEAKKRMEVWREEKEK